MKPDPHIFFETHVLACPMTGNPDLAMYPEAARFLVLAGVTPDEWYLHESWFIVNLPPSLLAIAKQISPKCVLYENERYGRLLAFEMLMGSVYNNLRAIALSTLKEQFDWEPEPELED